MHKAFSTLDPSNLIFPPPLNRGDRVAVFAPASPAAALFPARFAHALENMKRVLDVDVLVSRTCSSSHGINGFVSMSAAERANVFQQLVADPSVRAILCSIGGFNSAEILPLLNPELMARNPKIFIGYSDCTALLLGLQSIAGWVTFHGPCVMTQFGEFPMPLSYTIESFQRVVCYGASPWVLVDPGEWTNERLEWAEDEWCSRPRNRYLSAGYQIWREGVGRGRSFGGNIETLNFLVGTGYLSIPDHIVLFWEAAEAEAFLPRIRRALTHLRQTRVLDRCSAMLVGRSPDSTSVGGVTLRETVLEATDGYIFPIVADIPLGHADPIATLPVGVLVDVAANGNGVPRITVLEAGVQER